MDMENKAIMVALKKDLTRKGVVVAYDHQSKRMTVQFAHSRIEGHRDMFVPLVYKADGSPLLNIFSTTTEKTNALATQTAIV